MKYAVSFLLAASIGHAEPMKLTLLADGIQRPVDLRVAPGNDSHLFIVEQTGKILAIDRKSGKREETVIDLGDRIFNGHNEEGLLGLAFSPTYSKDHRFYVYYSQGNAKSRHTQVSRFILDPVTLKADREKEEKLLTFKQDFGNHNGGWIDFGPDGYLWIGAGDGGKANDPLRRAQDLGNLLGSLLRIDVSGEKGYRVPTDNPFLKTPGAEPEIYAYGLRNPWRCSFDAKTGDLWVADVGQWHWEEVNFVPAGKVSGKNFGWRPREGTHKTYAKGVGGPVPKDAHEPIYQYGHNTKKKTDGLSITGGYVYRGSRKELHGKYFFADYATRRIWSIEQDGGKMKNFTDHTDQLLVNGKQVGPISSFGQDHQNELYVLDHLGKVYRLE